MKPNPKPGPARLMDFLQALRPGDTGWSAGGRASCRHRSAGWNELVIDEMKYTRVVDVVRPQHHGLV